MDALIEACRQLVGAVPPWVHWGIMFSYFFVSMGLFAHVEGLSKAYLEEGDSEERKRCLRLLLILFGTGALALPYTLLIDQEVFPEGVFKNFSGRSIASVFPALCLIAALFYGVKVLRRPPS
ncbi:MAG: hypothetical protein KF912_06740 [Phycisphaeraceae bacterium]|nr:hypothetical protein [Phycisphaeraceae bacterium]MBX3366996.1 hypothetical protein [Phycisphaeraceae bacterium]